MQKKAKKGSFLAAVVAVNRKKAARAKRWWDLYRITPTDYDEILRFQKGECPITGNSLITGVSNVDHCHRSGKVRGLLSPMVNKGLAFFRDDPALLRAAADYLENPPATIALGAPRYGLIGKAIRKKKPIYGPPA
jgi:hypothetical protein